MARLLRLVALLCATAVAIAPGALWVSPGESGALERAVAAAGAAAAPASMTIHLEEGRHALASPLSLGSRHSGIHFVGHGAASISGGTPIGGSWELAGPAYCAGCAEIWRAPIPEAYHHYDSRQLYLPNTDDRANRTWMALPAGGPGEDSLGRVTVVGNPGRQIAASWRRNLTAIDLVYRGTASAGVQWIEARCPCAGVSRSSNQSGGMATVLLHVADPCWRNAHSWRDPAAHAGPAFVENVFELLGTAEFGHAGEFYLDSARREVFYVPRALEVEAGRAVFVAILPVVESLLQVDGARDLSFSGITFEHTTWMRPSSPVGFVETQAGDCLVCTAPIPAHKSPGSPTRCVNHSGTPAALTFVAARNVTLFKNTFRHMGANAVAFRAGSHGNTVSRCEFTQLSASAVEIGTRGGSAAASNDFTDNDVYFHSKPFLGAAAAAAAAACSIQSNLALRCAPFPFAFVFSLYNVNDF